MGETDRRAPDPWRENISERMGALEAGHQSLANQIKANTELTEGIKKNTDELMSVFKAIKGAITVAGWGGTLAKWVTVVAIGVGVVVYFFKTGDLPKK